MPMTYWDLYAKFQTSSSKRLALALPNIPGGPKMQNFGTFFFTYLAQNSHLLLNLKAEIWHKYAHYILGLVCKISDI